MIVKEQLAYRFGWTTKVSLAVAAALLLPLSAELRSSRAETATQRTNGEHGTGADLVGKWTVTACTFGGQPDPSAIGDVHTILNDRMIRPNRRTQYGYNVDEEGEINLTAPRLGDEHLRGIYALDGDTLRICYAYEPEMRRPSEFVSPQGKRVYLYEYKRHASESDGSLAISPRGPAVEPDLTGEWRITAATYGGRANPSLVGSIHTILSDRMIRPGLRTQYGYNVVEKGEINLTAPRLGDKHLRGIYALDGDTLRICYAYEPEMRRPSKFVSPAGRRIYLYEYQRVSDESRPRATARTAARPTARWARLSPFTHVQCLEGDNVAVTFGNSNYELVSIDGLPTADILRSARKQFGGLWEKRFVEDLVEVLAGMGHPPADSVALVLREPKSGVLRKVPRAPLTRDNRMQVYRSRYRTSSDQTETSLLQKMATNPESTEREKLAALRRLRFATTPEGDARTHEVIVAMIALAKATKDSSIRADVFRQLDGVTDPVLENVLLDALANDPNASVRSEAAETLAQYRSSRVTAALASAEDGDESPDVRAEARRSLDER